MEGPRKAESREKSQEAEAPKQKNIAAALHSPTEPQPRKGIYKFMDKGENDHRQRLGRRRRLAHDTAPTPRRSKQLVEDKKGTNNKLAAKKVGSREKDLQGDAWTERSAERAGPPHHNDVQLG